MRFGYWMPVFGGWLRNVRDEQMSTDWAYVRALAVESEAAGFDLSLLAELNLNDIKGHAAPTLDAWTLAPAVAAVTERLELMLAVRPNYHSPSLTAKAISTLDTIAPGRVSLNVVSSWWRDEALQYGAPFDVHDARYARTDEWLEVLQRLLTEPEVTHHGDLYDLEACVMEPKPSALPTVYMGGESPRAKEVISRRGTAYVMHGDPPEVIAGKVRDMSARAAEHGRSFRFGVSGYAIVRDTEQEARQELARITTVRPESPGFANFGDWTTNTQLERPLALQDYSVSNRGLRAGLVGTAEQVADRVRAYQAAGVDLLLLQCIPQLEEMECFAAEVMPLVGGPVRAAAA